MNGTFTDRSWTGPVAVIAAAMLFGTTGTTRALGPAEATTLGVGAVRLAVGAVLLALGVAVLRRPWTQLHVGLVLAGGLAVAGYQITFFTGTTRTGVAAGTVTALVTGPVVAGIVDARRHRRWPNRQWVTATLVAVSGVTLALGAAGGVRLDLLGTVAAVAAGTCYAVYATTVGIQIQRGCDPLATMAATFMAGAVLIAPLLVAEPLGWLTSGRGALVATHLGFATVAIAYALYAFGLTRLAVPTAVTLTLAEPVTASLLGRFVLDEALTPGAWVGLGLVMIGLVLVGRTSSQPTSTRSTAGAPRREH